MGQITYPMSALEGIPACNKISMHHRPQIYTADPNNSKDILYSIITRFQPDPQMPCYDVVDRNSTMAIRRSEDTGLLSLSFWALHNVCSFRPSLHSLDNHFCEMQQGCASNNCMLILRMWQTSDLQRNNN